MNPHHTADDQIRQSDLRAQSLPPAPPSQPPREVEGSTYYHYVIVRADLPRGLQVAQVIHAAGESAANGPVPEGTHAVALQVESEEHLLDVADQLGWAKIPFKLIIEPDLPLYEDRPLQDGQGTAIGIPPVSSLERKRLKTLLGRLPLLR